MDYLKIRVKFLATCMIMLTFLSCKKDSVSESLDNVQLSETIWEGTLILKENKTIPIRITFENSSDGNYFIVDKYKEDLSGYASNSPLTYAKKNKILCFDKGYNNILMGDWWIKEIKGDNIVLFRQTGEKTDNLTIHKTN